MTVSMAVSVKTWWVMISTQEVETYSGAVNDDFTIRYTQPCDFIILMVRQLKIDKLALVHYSPIFRLVDTSLSSDPV